MELFSENRDALRLARFLIAESPLANSYPLVLAQRYAPEEVDKILLRADAALSDERVQAELRRRHQKAADEMRRQSKR